MIRYKTDIIEALASKGHTWKSMRESKILSQATMQALRHGQSINFDSLDKICKILGAQPGSLIEYIDPYEEVKSWGRYVIEAKPGVRSTEPHKIINWDGLYAALINLGYTMLDDSYWGSSKEDEAKIKSILLKQDQVQGQYDDGELDHSLWESANEDIFNEAFDLLILILARDGCIDTGDYIISKCY